jgi:hypothetical protein
MPARKTQKRLVRSRRLEITYRALRQVAEYLNCRLEPLTGLRRQIEALKNLDRQKGHRREEPFRYRSHGTWSTIQLSYFSRGYLRQRWQTIATHNRALGRPDPDMQRLRREHRGKWEYKLVHGLCPTPTHTELKLLRLLAEAFPEMSLLAWVPALQDYHLKSDKTDGWKRSCDMDRRSDTAMWCGHKYGCDC